MNKITEKSEKTRKLLIKHYQTYPQLQIEDIFKYIFQSAFGCEHLVSNESAALDYIKSEYDSMSENKSHFFEELDGRYCRVHLSYLNAGLKPATLARLFCLSAKNEPSGKCLLEQKLETAKMLVGEGALPFDKNEFERKLSLWREQGYPAIHHSDIFRSEYAPAYRVIDKRYVGFLDIFSAIDQALEKGTAIIAIEGGSAGGKTTLAEILKEVYDCNVVHMDDFFLRPEQRTPQRFAEVGGNVDRERFYEEILISLSKNETVRYRPFDCSTQTLKDVVTVEPKKLTVVEGVYSMHPAFGKYYDLSVFLDIDPEYQKKRILVRNSPWLAKRFFEEWIPLENIYFSKMRIKEMCEVTKSIMDF